MDQFWESVSSFSYFEYVIAIIALTVITLIIQLRLWLVMKKYGRIGNSRNMTGAEAARAILEANGVYDVDIQMLASDNGDNYNSRTKVLSLSQSNYRSTSITAVGVAAHEAGHALQHSRGYLPHRIRNVLAPAAYFGSKYGFMIVLVGLLINSFSYSSIGYYLALAGLIFFGFSVLFSVVTLPSEFNASKRARKALTDVIALDKTEIKSVRKVLNCAAMTYVASLGSALLSLLRMLSIVSGMRRK